MAVLVRIRQLAMSTRTNFDANKESKAIPSLMCAQLSKPATSEKHHACTYAYASAQARTQYTHAYTKHKPVRMSRPHHTHTKAHNALQKRLANHNAAQARPTAEVTQQGSPMIVYWAIKSPCKKRYLQCIRMRVACTEPTSNYGRHMEAKGLFIPWVALH